MRRFHAACPLFWRDEADGLRWARKCNDARWEMGTGNGEWGMGRSNALTLLRTGSCTRDIYSWTMQMQGSWIIHRARSLVPARNEERGTRKDVVDAQEKGKRKQEKGKSRGLRSEKH